MYLIKLTSQSALEVDGRITGTLDEHKKYFDYLKAGNGDKAYSILIDHLAGLVEGRMSGLIPRYFI